MPQRNPEEFNRQKRFIMIHLLILLFIQVVITLSYYFVEKQVVLAFPMILGILITFSAIVTLSQLNKG